MSDATSVAIDTDIELTKREDTMLRFRDDGLKP